MIVNKYCFFIITFRIYKICYTYQRLYKGVWRYDDLLFRYFYNVDEHILWMFKLFCKKKILNKLIKQLKDKELFINLASKHDHIMILQVTRISKIQDMKK